MEKQMVMSRSKLRESANAGVIRNLRECILLNLVILLLAGGVPFLVSLFLSWAIPLVGTFLSWIFLLIYILFVLNLLDMGIEIAALRIAKGEPLAVGDVFEAFSDYSHCCFGMFWYRFRVFLWNLIPIIGVMKAYSYALTPYLLYTNPELSAEDAIQKSADLMHGHRMEMLILNLSFIGWNLLSAASGGILGVLYATMYQRTTWAHAFLEMEKSFDGRDTSRKVFRRSYRAERRASVRRDSYIVRCPYCGTEYAYSSGRCPKCGSAWRPAGMDSPLDSRPAPFREHPSGGDDDSGFHTPKKL